MPIEILMPAASPTMKSGKIAKWLKNIGDTIAPGDVMLEIETDKATMEVDSSDYGTLAKIVAQNGSKVNVGVVIGLLKKKGESDSDIENYTIKQIESKTTEDSSKPQQEARKSEAVLTQTSPSTATSNTRIFASPLAKRIAQEKGINISTVVGTGPHGRVIKSDVENLQPSRAGIVTRNSVEYQEIALSTMREVVASRLTESKQNIPHFYIDAKCDVANLIAVRQKINSLAPKDQSGKPEYKLSVNDLIVKICATAMAKFPAINSSWGGDRILLYNNVDISVAVSIPNGLVTPIIRNADQKNVFQISKEIKSLASRAKNNSLNPEEYQGGGFTISNLGMYGIDNFHAIINPPQSCILAVGGVRKEVVVGDGNSTKITDVVTISISVDHRVIDGVLAAEFISYFRDLLEYPALLAFQ